MKRNLICLVFLALAACAPPPPTLVPIDTLVVQTMSALAKTGTPIPALTPTTRSNEPSAATAVRDEDSAADEKISVEADILVAPGAQCIPKGTERTQARVTRVIDGDTIEVAIGNDVYKVRYIGIDSPEATTRIERLGAEASAANKQLVGSQVVTLVKDASETDPYGRLLRYVFVDHVFINYELVRQGYASAATFPPDVACQAAFLSAEQEARSVFLGLWAPTPVPSPTATRTPTPTPEVTPTAPLPPACDCSRENVSCNSFKTQAKAQACFEYCKSEGLSDVFGLDKNGNGKACEGMP